MYCAFPDWRAVTPGMVKAYGAGMGWGGHCLGFGVKHEQISNTTTSYGKVSMTVESVTHMYEGTAETVPANALQERQYIIQQKATTAKDTDVLQHKAPQQINTLAGCVLSSQLSSNACKLVKEGGIPVLKENEKPNDELRFHKYEGCSPRFVVSGQPFTPQMFEKYNQFAKGSLDTMTVATVVKNEKQRLLDNICTITTPKQKYLETIAEYERRGFQTELETYAGGCLPMANCVQNEHNHAPKNIVTRFEFSVEAEKKMGAPLPFPRPTEYDMIMENVTCKSLLEPRSDKSKPYLLKRDGTKRYLDDITDYREKELWSVRVNMRTTTDRFLQKFMRQFDATEIMLSNFKDNSAVVTMFEMKTPLSSVTQYDEESEDSSHHEQSVLDAYQEQYFVDKNGFQMKRKERHAC